MVRLLHAERLAADLQQQMDASFPFLLQPLLLTLSCPLILLLPESLRWESRLPRDYARVPRRATSPPVCHAARETTPPETAQFAVAEVGGYSVLSSLR